MKRPLVTALLAVTFVSCSFILLPGQTLVESGPWKSFKQEHPSLSNVEIPSPFVLRRISGTVTWNGGKPLKGAYVEIGLREGETLGTDSDSKGSFQLSDFRFVRVFGIFGPFVQSAALRPGTYRFKVTKDGFHSTVGTIVISADAPKESILQIDLVPGEGYEEPPPPEDSIPSETLIPLSDALPVFETPRHKKWPEKYSAVYMPVSLAVGRVRTSDFPVDKQWYNIALHLEKRLPFRDLVCMLGKTWLENCSGSELLLRGYWTVWEGEHIVAKGWIPDNGPCIFGDKDMFECLGGFAGEAGKRYVVQVRFTLDGTPLNVTNPRLMVIRHKDLFGE